ncbi:MAG: RC-LH1 core complex protein PufX [Paracoccaceae bacterium]
MDEFSFEPSRKVKLFLWAGKEMGRGFMWALGITTVIVVGLLVLRAIGLYVLPEASQEAPQPMGAIMQPAITDHV